MALSTSTWSCRSTPSATNVKPQCPAHVERRLHDGEGPGILDQRVDEGLVELDRRDRQLAQAHEGRLPDAEVVQRHPEADGPQLGEGPQGLLGAVDQKHRHDRGPHEGGAAGHYVGSSWSIAASTRSAWDLAWARRHTFSTVPSAPSRTLERITPTEDLPYRIFSPHAP